MNSARHHSLQEQVLHSFLKLPDQHHLSVQGNKKLRVVRHDLPPQSTQSIIPASMISFTLLRNAAAVRPLMSRWSAASFTVTRGRILTSPSRTTGFSCMA